MNKSFSDKVHNLEELKLFVKDFCEDRDWDQFHNAKELAIGAVTEASELLEHFRFQSSKQVEEIMASGESRQEVSDEMADVLFFLLRMAQKYDIDLAQSFSRKMEKNNKRYPAKEFRGKNHKSKHI